MAMESSEEGEKKEMVSSVLTIVFPDYTAEDSLEREEVDEDGVPIKKVVQEEEDDQVLQDTQKLSKIPDFAKSPAQWLKEFIEQLSSWLTNQPVSDIPLGEEEIVDIWKEWEWVLSRTEEFTFKQTAADAAHIKQELQQLRETTIAMKFRPYFTSVAREAIAKLPEEDQNDLEKPLLASESSKIIADVIGAFEQPWLDLIQQLFFIDDNEAFVEFRNHYREKPYEKNLVGSLRELAFAASHGPKDVGINTKVLSDMLWSLWKTLAEAIRRSLVRELTHEELSKLAHKVSQAGDMIIDLWISTERNSRLGRAKEGVLVEKWNKEKEEHDRKLAAIKERGADAKWAYQPYDPKSVQTIKRKNLEAFKKALEAKLSLNLN